MQWFLSLLVILLLVLLFFVGTNSCSNGGKREKESDNSLVGQLLLEDPALRFHQHLPDKRKREREKVGGGGIRGWERHIHYQKGDLLIQHGSKNPIIYSSPHCPGALVTQMGTERDDTRGFNPSSAGRLGGWSTDGRWPHCSPWTQPIYLVLFLLPYWIVALLTHLYNGHYRYSLSHTPTILPAGVYCRCGLPHLFQGKNISPCHVWETGGQSIAQLCWANDQLWGDVLR